MFWLDPEQRDGRGQHYMGSSAGRGAEIIRYRVDDRVADIRHDGITTRQHDVDIFALLKSKVGEIDVAGLPASCPFPGGYFGYELMALTRGPNRHRSNTPDAYWIRPESFILYDHRDNRAHVVYLSSNASTTRAHGDQRLDALCQLLHAASAKTPEPFAESGEGPSGNWRLSKRDYVGRISQAIRALQAVESYEICLTDTFEMDSSLDGLDYYCALRQKNPLPTQHIFA